MKLLTFLLLITFMQVNAEGYSQAVTLYEKNKSIETILEAIEKQSDYFFLYDKLDLPEASRVTINVTSASIGETLHQLFKDLPLTFKIFEKTIVITRKWQKPPEASVRKQEYRISGVVTDAETGESLPGVTVLLKNSQIGTSTDLDGKYSLTLPENMSDSTLVYSFIGYLTQEIPVGGRETIDMKLEKDVAGLEEVVVVGYGSQKRVNVTGSISTVNMQRIENAPLTNASQTLQGVQGVYVNQAGGQPGRDAATIRIRGQGTFNNNNPLVLVNGIEYPLSDINPNDIESISVLKDAASAAIYGSRAANGVILVTTKTGLEERFKLDYNNYFGAQAVTYLPDVVKDPVQFMKLRNQAQLNEGRQVIDYPESMIEEYAQGMLTDPNIYPNNDWFDIMFSHGLIQNHNLRFSGGTEKLAYSLSLDYMDQKGVLMGTSTDRFSLNMNATADITDRLKIGSNINGVYRNIDEPAAGVSNLMEMTLKAQAFHPTYLEDGSYANTFIRTPGHNIYRHPLALANEGEDYTREQQYLINLFAEYSLPFNITYKINFGVNKSDDVISRFIPDVYTYQVKTGETQRIPFDGDMPNRGARNRSNTILNTTLFNTLKWEHSFNDANNVSILGGMSYEDFSDSYFWAQNEGYLGNDLYEINAGSTNPAVEGTSTRSRLSSFFGRLGYNYREKYLFEANFRLDGSSRFAAGNRWGLFPSFSAGWRMEKEHFLSDVSWLNELKLRASWGELGNERIGLFKYVDLITLGLDYPFGNNIASGAAATAYNDPSITWETTTISNLGLDAGLLDNRLGLVFDVFKKRTRDILREVNLPAQVGDLDGPIRNIGTVDNTGFELGLEYQGGSRDFTYQFSGSLTKIRNEVVDLKGQVIYNGRNIIQEGYPINSYYLLHAEGIFQSEEEIANSPFQNNNTKPGYLKYKDVDDDGVISENDRVAVGGVIPEYTYQFSFNLGYKGFQLSSFFQGVQNVNTYTERIAAMPFWFGTAVTKEWVTDSWTPDNPGARLPILTTYEGSQDENFRNSDFWLKDASYLRLKNVQISYSLPESVTNKLKISRLKLFVNGQNLLTLSKMEDFDPEKNINGSTFYEYPTVKMYTAGINATF